MSLTREEHYEADNLFKELWGWSSWSDVEGLEKILREKKASALQASGWRRDPSALIIGEDLWYKEIEGIPTRLPFEVAVKWQAAQAKSEVRDDAYNRVHRESLKGKGREAGPDAVNPYPPGSLGYECWEAGRSEKGAP